MRAAGALTLLLLGLPRSGIAQRPPDTAFRALDAWLRTEFARLRVPGAAVAVVRGDSLVHGAVFGRASESGGAITLDTPFLIGSIGKSMTAVAVMQLVDAGAVAVDTPVTRYLPWFHPTGETGWGRVTVRHLLNQTSGIPAYAGRQDWADSDTSAGALERHTRGLAAVRLAHPPGTAFEYANANFALLGQVIQAASGTSYERYIEDHVFRPLAMNRSFTSRPAAQRHGMAPGHRFWFGHPVGASGMPFVRRIIPAGYQIASASDMARYLSAHLEAGRYPGGTLVSPAAMEEMHRPAATMTDHWSYAMGWMSGTLAGRTVLWHNGLVPDFYAFVALVPERGEGMVILTNVGNLLDMPRLNRAAFGGLMRLLAADAGLDPVSCPMCPAYPRVPGGAVLAVRPTAMGLLALQCGWIAWSVTKRRWRSKRGNVRSLALAVCWGTSVLFLLPLVARMPLSVMSDFMPDLAAVVYASVAIALAWAFVRAALASRVARSRARV